MLSGWSVNRLPTAPSILLAWKVQREPCWSNSAQNIGNGNIMKATFHTCIAQNIKQILLREKLKTTYYEDHWRRTALTSAAKLVPNCFAPRSSQCCSSGWRGERSATQPHL